MTRKRTLLGVVLALAVAVALLVVFVSRPTWAETVVARIQVGRPIADAKAVLGRSKGPVFSGGPKRPIGYFWVIEDENIFVYVNDDQIVTSVQLRGNQLDWATRVKKFVRLD